MKARVAAAWAASLLVLCSACESPLRVAVLLPLSGESDVGWRQPLGWALENINRAGGIAGRRLELSYEDTATIPIDQAAAQAIEDDSIVGVIGPKTSPEVFQVAPAFLQAKKTFVSPSATATNIFRAFAGKQYVWRTVGSDVNQVQAMLLLAVNRGAQKIALLAADDEYGGTFLDWLGFFATELELEVTAIVRWDEASPDCSDAVAQALAGQPDVLLLVPSLASAATCEARAARQAAPSTPLIFSDSGRFPGLIDDLGEAAEGIEGTSPAPDPTSGFETAYRIWFGTEPPADGANVYDALCLLAYGLERSGGRGGEKLAKALAEVVDARGAETGWDRQGVADSLAAIRSGKLPDLRGAGSSLNFDEVAHVEPVTATYGHWHIEAGQFVDVGYISTGDTKWTRSLAASFASASRMESLDDTGSYQPGPQTGTWAFIAALSTGWSNYRHQADALAQYQMLRSSGMADDHIVFIIADDLAQVPENGEPGVVRNVVGGPNLYHDLQIDYRLSEVDAGDLMAILGGESSSRLPTVIESTAGDDLYVFLVGHGDSFGAIVDGRGGGTSAPGMTALDSSMIEDTLEGMFAAQRYRRVLMVVEVCEGGTLGAELAAPGTVLFTGANPTESSFGANYDPDLKTWLADEFAYQFFLKATGDPTVMLTTLYPDLYAAVSGSHVSVYNDHGFGHMAEVSLNEFIE